ncbi:hypothetical protein ACQ4M4_08455 [Leptolyngbya sp. AN02str]
MPNSACHGFWAGNVEDLNRILPWADHECWNAIASIVSIYVLPNASRLSS